MIKLIENDKRFWFQFDIDGNNFITISDIFILIKQIFLLPGDSVMYCLAILSDQPILKFFEISNIPEYGNFLSWFISLVFWAWVFFWGTGVILYLFKKN